MLSKTWPKWLTWGTRTAVIVALLLGSAFGLGAIGETNSVFDFIGLAFYAIFAFPVISMLSTLGIPINTSEGVWVFFSCAMAVVFWFLVAALLGLVLQKKWPHWLKIGIVFGLVAAIIHLFVQLALNNPVESDMTWGTSILAQLVGQFTVWPAYIFYFFGIGNYLTYSHSGAPTVLGSELAVIMWFVIGVGLSLVCSVLKIIFQKIKNRKHA